MISALLKPVPMLVLLSSVGLGVSEIDKLGQEAFGAVMTVKTQYQMQQLVKALRIDFQASKTLPPQELLSYFARSHMRSPGSDPALDGWGSPWQIVEIGGDSFLLSCGQDKRCNTADDIDKMIIDARGRFVKP